MKLRLANNVIPRVELDEEQRQRLADEAAAVLAETVRAERAHHASRGAVPSKHWTVVRRHEGFTVFRQRNPSASTSVTSATTSTASSKPTKDKKTKTKKTISGGRIFALSAFAIAGGGRTLSKSAIVSSATLFEGDNRGDSVTSRVSEDSPVTSSSSSRSSSSGASITRSVSAYTTSSTDSYSHIRDTNNAHVHSGGGPGGWTALATDPTSLVMQRKAPHTPILIGCGELDGSVEDSVFGSLADEPVSWRLRTAVIRDKIADAKLVAPIHGPTPEDPCRFLGVKWLMREVPPMLGSLVHPRDHVVLEATGFVRAEDDEDKAGGYGYHLVHSIELPQIPELESIGVVRSRISLCFITRQVSARRVQIFCRGFSNPRGKLSVKVATALSADVMIAVTKIGECAHAKKLQWLAECKAHARQNAAVATTTTRPSALCDVWAMQEGTDTSKCSCCHATQGGDVKHTFGLAAARFPMCGACGEVMCERCTVQKKTLVDADVRTVSFCAVCNVEAQRLSSLEVAKHSRHAPAHGPGPDHEPREVPKGHRVQPRRAPPPPPTPRIRANLTLLPPTSSLARTSGANPRRSASYDFAECASRSLEPVLRAPHHHHHHRPRSGSRAESLKPKVGIILY